MSSVSTVGLGVPTRAGVAGRLEVAEAVLRSLGFEWIFLRQPLLLSGILSADVLGGGALLIWGKAG